MDLSKDWIRSEFINHEILEQHRILENELTFYNAIVDGNIEYIEENIRQNTFTNPKTNSRTSAITLSSQRQ